MQLPLRARRLLLLGGSACTMIGGIVLWKDSLAGEKYVNKEEPKVEKRTKSQEDKVFIVTGANTGKFVLFSQLLTCE